MLIKPHIFVSARNIMVVPITVQIRSTQASNQLYDNKLTTLDTQTNLGIFLCPIKFKNIWLFLECGSRPSTGWPPCGGEWPKQDFQFMKMDISRVRRWAAPIATNCQPNRPSYVKPVSRRKIGHILGSKQSSKTKMCNHTNIYETRRLPLPNRSLYGFVACGVRQLELIWTRRIRSCTSPCRQFKEALCPRSAATDEGLLECIHI